MTSFWGLRPVPGPVDRQRSSRVSSLVARKPTIFMSFATLALAASVGACGGGDKKKVNDPNSSSATISSQPMDGTGGDPADMNPEGGLDTPSGDPVAAGPDGAGDPGDPAAPTDSASPDDPGDGAEGDGGEAAKPPPVVKPPGLDLSAAEKQRRVSGHLKSARAAVRGKNKDPDRAISEAQAALAVDETSVQAMVLLAHGNYLKKYYDKAEDVLGKALARKGANNKQLHFLFGLVYEKTKRPAKAMGSFQKAVAIDPDYKSALLNLGIYYLQNKQFDKAEKLYERLSSDLNLNTAATWNNLGSAYRGRSSDYAATDVTKRNGYLLKAERAYRRALSVTRNYPGATYNLGLLYLDADPFPTKSGDMDLIKRLQRAKTYFDEYRRLPGADQKLVDEQAAVVQKLHDKELRLREKRRKAAEREKKMKELEKEGGDDGFE
jgi:tetratricopeptide (TPR) repeat protein